MAEVWLVRRKGKECERPFYAVLPHFADDGRYVRMFRSELELSKMLTRHNIVKVCGAGTGKGRAYLVMEWIDGTTLERVTETLSSAEPSSVERQQADRIEEVPVIPALTENPSDAAAPMQPEDPAVRRVASLGRPPGQVAVGMKTPRTPDGDEPSARPTWSSPCSRFLQSACIAALLCVAGSCRADPEPARAARVDCETPPKPAAEPLSEASPKESAPAPQPDPPGPALWDGPCPPGMTLVPGGAFTKKQLAEFERIHRLIGAPYERSIDDFCLDLTEVTHGAVVRCIHSGDCKDLDALPPFARVVESWVGVNIRVLNESEPFLRNWGGSQDAWAEPLAAWAAMPIEATPAQAEAICHGSGKRLPTVEEWMWAYWGGTEHRRYPWGSSKAPLRKAYERRKQNSDQPVGTLPEGAGRWGHLDLATNRDEIVAMKPFDSPHFEEPYHSELTFEPEVDFRDEGYIPSTLCKRPWPSGRNYHGTTTFPCGARARAAIAALKEEPDEDSASFEDILRGARAVYYSLRGGFRCALAPRPIPPPEKGLWLTAQEALAQEPATNKKAP